ncbi:MAG: OB-fold domain-containing protein [Microthrixaceae bacterium]
MSDDRTITPLPTGLWSQPTVDTSAVADALDGTETVQRVRQPASIRYDFVPGVATTRFLKGLANKQIFGERDPLTGDVYVPPRGVCPVSAQPTTEQVELSHKGSVSSFCVVHIGFGTNAPPTPFCSALILLDGAVISLYGPIQEIPYDQVRIGMRVEAVWADDADLSPSFESIKWWRPIDEPDVAAETLKGHM